VVSTLGGLAAAVQEAELASPSIVVIGDVVSQRVESCAPEPALVEMPIPLK
jgi:uroporphyrin-III C-methyltransferase